jgi:16S rRNA U516 pseudouridylate synthase RsuA-like enzyme
MTRRKRKLTAQEKAEKKRRQKEFMFIFINGKQKRVRRPPTIDGIPVDEFIRQNADPIWLHQNEMWEYMEQPEPMSEEEQRASLKAVMGESRSDVTDDDIPF